MLLDFRSLVYATTIGLQLIGYTPTVQQAEGVASPDTVISSSADTLTLTGQQSIIGTGLIPDVGSLALTGQASPSGNGLIPSSGSLTFNGQASSLGTGLIVPVGTLTLNGFAPSLSQTIGIGLVLTGHVPTVLQAGGADTSLKYRIIRGNDATGKDDWWISYQA